MSTNETLCAIENANRIDELHEILQSTISNLGFSAYNFLDTGQPHIDQPYYFGTAGNSWESEYANNGFIGVDLAVSKARRTNLPFNWRSLKLPKPNGRHRSRAWDVMEAAKDHNLNEGLVIPLHFTDDYGRQCSSLTVLFWQDQIQNFDAVIQENKFDLHLILLYWMHKANSLILTMRKEKNSIDWIRPIAIESDRPILSERERDVLAWAARGKTTRDTSEILNISTETVETYLKNARIKLNANNKSHSVALALYHKLIDV